MNIIRVLTADGRVTGRKKIGLRGIEAEIASEDMVATARLIVAPPEIFSVVQSIRVRIGMRRKTDRSGTADLRTVLCLIRTEIPQFVLDDGSAKRAAVLFVREREYSFCDGIGRVEDIVAEVTEGRPVNGIRSRLALHIHGKLSGTTLRGIKLVGNDLELRDGIAAKLSLSEAGVRAIRGHLLAVKVELLTTSVQRAQRGVIGDSVPADAWNQGSEIHVITAVERNFLEGLGVDVSGHLRGCGVDGSDIIGHRYGGGRTCQR